MGSKKQDANNLFDAVKKEAGIDSDAAFARALGVHAPTITNMRSNRIDVGPTIIIKIMESFHTPLPRIRRLLAGIKD